MLIGARQLFNKTTEILPYDAEVEYIGSVWQNSSVKTYIDICLPSFSDVYDFEAIVYDTDYNNKTICAALDSSPSLVWFFLAQTFNRKLDLNYGTNGTDDAGSVCFVNSKRMHVWSHIENGIQQGWVQNLTDGGNKILVTNTQYSANPAYTFSSNLRLFSRTNIESPGVSRMEMAKLSINGTLRFDFQPVRFTNEHGISEGAMYNKVSKVVFRNSGTGSFTIGPDKT